MPTAKKTNGKKNSVSSTRRKTAGTGTKRRPDKRALAKKKRFFSGEIGLILAGLFGLFLFLSNFGIMGAAGQLFSQIEKGLFGIVGYAFPVLLLLAVGFYVKNRGTFLAEAKLICSLLMIVILSGLMHLLFADAEAKTASAYYTAGAAGELSGGLIGGLCAGGLRAFFGTAGAYLVLIALLIICMVFVTERSFVNAAKNGAERTAQAARAGGERAREAAYAYRDKREARREEERIRREERLLRGVNFDATKLSDPAGEAKALSDEARLYAEYGKELVGSQPGMEDVDDGTGHGAIRGFGAPKAYSPSEADDSRFDTQVLPDPDVFRGKIEGLPDYEDDSVPFEEDRKETYRSWRFDQPDEPMDLKAAEQGGYAASGEGNAEAYEARRREPVGFSAFRAASEETSSAAGAFETASGALASQKETGDQSAGPLQAPEAGASGINDGFLTEVTGSGTFAEAFHPAGTSFGELAAEETEGSGKEADFASGEAPMHIVTATGKAMEATSHEAKELLRKKLAESMGQAEGAVHEAENQGAEGAGAGAGAEGVTAGGGTQAGSKDSRGTAKEQPAAPSSAENAAVAMEIQKKAAVKKPYVFPPLNLLKRGAQGSRSDQRELKETAVKLQQVLHTFGVGVTVTNVSMGPSVTRYELTPDVGVKVSRITSLADDIKLALAAADLRIEAPIPGKAAVGIEVPNKQKATVYLRDILDSDAFRESKSKLAFAIGRDIAGKTVVGDIAKMPHLLVAGATGSGKSVGINTLIMSLLYKSSPEDVRMIMIDPKVVELSVYNGIPHLLTQVVTDPKRAASTLNWAVAEMTDRYKKFAEAGVRDLKGYNQKAESVRKKLSGMEDEEKLPKKLPQIVIIVDELADLMMVAPGEVEDAIIRLTQLARAAGIHLIIATQRPSVNVITGLIKANVPSRIAFKSASGTDSRTILDMNGAEKLLGSGDMLYYPAGAAKPLRVQGAFVSDGEVQAVVDFIAKHQDADYSSEVESAITQQSFDAGGSQAGDTEDGRDEYFAQAARLIVEKDKASIGMLQRMFKIGFNRAARVMDQLCEAGVVGPEEGTKPRKILMTAEELEAFLSR